VTIKPGPTERLSILVVDDEPAMRALLKQALELAGHAVSEAHDGQDALAVLERDPVDLILTDLRMDGLSGLDLLKTVREKFPQVGVMIITGFATLEAATDAMRLGAFDMVTKPVNLEDLAGKVATFATKRIRAKAGQAAVEGDAVEARPLELPVCHPQNGHEKADSLDKILDIPVFATVLLGKAQLQIADVLRLGAGSVIELDKRTGELVELLVNDKPIALGEIVVVNDTLGFRVTSILDPKQRIHSLT